MNMDSEVHFKELLEHCGGKEAKLIVFIEHASDYAQEFADLINICVEKRLKVISVKTPPLFQWKDEHGNEIEVNNFKDNKAIFTFEAL